MGLIFLSKATGVSILLAATLYGIGKAFFWLTTIGVVAEQFPKGGALSLNAIAGVGMLAVGTFGSPILGFIQDQHVDKELGLYDEINQTALHETYVIDENIVRCPSKETADRMINRIEEVKNAGDTVGGAIVVVAKNVPSGWGEPVFDKLEADLAKEIGF
mgnify:CR=1 FL=1